jgi:hypothetical protein
MFLSRPPKQLVPLRSLALVPRRLLIFLLSRRLVAAHVLFVCDFLAFAMIRLVRRLYDPDATSAL